MKRLAAIGLTLMVAAACGSDTPTTPTAPTTGPFVFTAQLSAANEVPPVTNTEANGRGIATVTMTVPRNSTTGAVTGPGSIDFSVPLTNFPAGTTVRAAELRSGAAGANGLVIVDTGLTATTAITLDLNGAGTLTFNNVAVTQTNAALIVASPVAFYFNVRTATNPDGAVRGQLVKQ